METQILAENDLVLSRRGDSFLDLIREIEALKENILVAYRRGYNDADRSNLSDAVVRTQDLIGEGPFVSVTDARIYDL